MDFTGGIPELIDLTRIKMPPERLFYIMSKADDRNAFMGCALSVRPVEYYMLNPNDGSYSSSYVFKRR